MIRISPDDLDRLYTLDDYTLHQISFSKHLERTECIGCGKYFDLIIPKNMVSCSGNFTLGFEFVFNAW